MMAMGKAGDVYRFMSQQLSVLVMMLATASMGGYLDASGPTAPKTLGAPVSSKGHSKAAVMQIG